MVGFPVACNLASVMNSFLGLSALCFFSPGEEGISAFLRSQLRGWKLSEKDKLSEKQLLIK